MLPNDKGLFQWIDKTLLVVPREGEGAFQRPITREDRVRKMAMSWSWPLCGAITVVRYPDGNLIVAEGGHRKAAADSLDAITALPCLVFPASGPVEAADLFRRLNRDRVALGAIDDFRAAHVMADPEAIEISRLAEKVGRTVSRSTGPGTIGGVAKIARLLHLDRGGVHRIFPLAGKLFAGKPFDTGVFHVLHSIEVSIKGREKGASLVDHEAHLLRVGLEAVRTAILRDQLQKRTIGGALSSGTTGVRVSAAIAVVDMLNQGRRGRKDRIELEFSRGLDGAAKGWASRRERAKAAAGGGA